MKEIWKPIKGYEDKYKVSTFGRIKSIAREQWNGHVFHFVKSKLLKGLDNGHGYLGVALWSKNKQKRVYIHRLVARTFIPNPENKKEVNHIDGNKSNNHITNLEWATRKENAEHASNIGLLRNGENCASARYSNQDIINMIWMYNLGYRQNYIARIFECVPTHAGKILRNEIWRDITL